MRHILLMVAGLLALSAVAAAQGPAGAGSGSGKSSRHSSFSSSDLSQWQLSVGYQYNRINLLGVPFNTDGANVTLTRFLTSWFGLDAQLGAGFLGKTGTTTNPNNLGVHSLFVGGGPRVAIRGRSRFEPWVHATAGLQDFRFTQTAGILGSNHGFGLTAGGGMDITLSPHLGLREEADIIETNLFSNLPETFPGRKRGRFQFLGSFGRSDVQNQANK
jgi:hypothetical protein